MRHPLSLVLVLMVVAACAPAANQAVYDPAAIGQVQRIEPGVVVATRAVRIGGSESGMGTSTGEQVGSAAGSAAAGPGPAGTFGGIGGRLVGGLIGSMAEQQVTSQAGTEYVVRLRDQSLISIVQPASPPLHVGDQVLVVHGQQSRVIADPQAAQSAGR